MSVCVSVRYVSERYIRDFDLFKILLLLILTGGYQHNARGVLGVGGYPSSHMLIISDIFSV